MTARPDRAGGGERPAESCRIGFPWPRPAPDAPPAVYAELREETPFARCAFGSGEPVWLATSYPAVKAVLASPALSSEHSHPGFPGVFVLRQTRDRTGTPPRLSYSALDGAEHRRHRGRIAGEFSRRAVAAHTGWIAQLAYDQLQGFTRSGPPADLVSGYARPFVAKVIAAVLGLTVREAAFCARLSEIILGDAREPVRVALAGRHLHTLVSAAIEVRRRAPRQDLLSRMIAAYETDGGFDHEQVLALAASLITAGLETSVHTISIGLLILILDPGRLEELRGDSTLLDPAVEEILRLSSVADIVTARVATRPCRVFETALPGGAGVVASTAAANRDGDYFPSGGRMDLDRGPPAHLAFGHGVHKCLGQHLARVIVRQAVAALVGHLETLRLADRGEAWTQSAGVMAGLSRLHVSWSRVRG